METVHRRALILAALADRPGPKTGARGSSTTKTPAANLLLLRSSNHYGTTTHRGSNDARADKTAGGTLPRSGISGKPINPKPEFSSDSIQQVRTGHNRRRSAGCRNPLGLSGSNCSTTSTCKSPRGPPRPAPAKSTQSSSRPHPSSSRTVPAKR